MKEFKIEDKSNDRRYFTIIPNYITDNSTSNDQSLYLQMKRHAGEAGICFVTQETLMAKMAIGKNSLHKSLNFLLEHRWIEYAGLTQGKTRPVKTYKVNDIWKINQDYYDKIPAETAVSSDKIVAETAVSSDKIVAETAVSSDKIVAETAGDSGQNSTKIVAETAVEEDIVEEDILRIYVTLANGDKSPSAETPVGDAANTGITKEKTINLNAEFFPLFEPLNPFYERLFPNKTERASLERIIRKLGGEQAKTLLEHLPQIVSMPFAPKITKPTELERDLGKIIQFLAQEKNKKVEKKMKVMW